MADPVLYASQGDLEHLLSPATVRALYDDGNGTVNQEALKGVLNRASRQVDSYLARVYKGPFPCTQVPVPELIKAVTLEFAIAYSFERHPEYVHTYGEAFRAKSKMESAREMAERCCNGLQEITDWAGQAQAGNIGGIVISEGPRTIIDGPNGEYNGGDF